MNITLIESSTNDIRYLSKDTACGFGTITSVGNSLQAKLLEYAKGKCVKIPPASSGYLSAIFKKYGHTVIVNDFKNADMVIIPTSIVDYRYELKIAEKVRESSSALVGFIGPFAGVRPEVFFKHADFVISGEPESAAIDIAKGKTPQGYIKSEPVDNLNSLPFPDWDEFNIESYSYFPSIRKKPFLTVQSSRGCPLSCGYYCPYPLVQGKKLRKRDANNVIKEILYLKRKYSLKGLMFRDPVFTLDKDRAKKIAKGIKDFDIEWGCETHLDYLDKELIYIMYESGLKTIELGIESMNKNSLKSIKRNSDYLNQKEELLQYCEKLGIRISAFYILGLPEDTRESIIKTIEYAKRLNTSAAQFTILTPYPGTQFFKEIKDRISATDWQEFDGYTPVFKHKNFSVKQIAALKEKAYLSYYYRFNWLNRFMKSLVV